MCDHLGDFVGVQLRLVQLVREDMKVLGKEPGGLSIITKVHANRVFVGDLDSFVG